MCFKNFLSKIKLSYEFMARWVDLEFKASAFANLRLLLSLKPTNLSSIHGVEDLEHFLLRLHSSDIAIDPIDQFVPQFDKLVSRRAFHRENFFDWNLSILEKYKVANLTFHNGVEK